MAARVAREDPAVSRALLRRSLLLALVAASACSRAPRAAAPSPASSMLAVVVRHGEKAPLPANDPVLSDAGIARAAALDSALQSMPITDVVVSHLQRTRLTALAFTSRTHAPVHVVPIGSAGVAAHVRAVADTVRAISRQPGHTGVLVVGHSNTVTDIVQALGGAASPALCDSQYSVLFTVREAAGGTVTSARTHYGRSDPADSTCAAMSPR